MIKINWNNKYTTIALYACIVLAIAVVGLMIGLNIKYFIGYISALLRAFSPIITGMIIAYICNPLLTLCERLLFSRSKKIKPNTSRLLSIVLTYIIVFIIVLLFALLIVPQIISSYNDLQSKFSYYLATAQGWADDLIREFPIFNGKYASFAEFLEANNFTERFTDFIADSYEHIKAITLFVVDFGGRFVFTVSSAVIGFILSFYFLFHKEKIIFFIKKLMNAFLSRKINDKIFGIAKFTHNIFGRFVLGKLLDSFIVGVLVFIILAIFKIPYYPLVSVIIGITDIIPFFGPFIGAVPSAFIILIADPVKALWFVLIILVVQQIDGNIIAPRIIGDTTGLSSVWILIAVIVMGAWLGVLGMFIGVPLFALIYNSVKNFIENRLRKKGLPTETTAYYDGNIDQIEA